MPSDPFKILLVDDDEATREIGSAVLESRGFRVECAESGDQALKDLRHAGTSFDMVLLDLVMPGKNGFETLREIRMDFSSDALTVFVLTSSDDRDDIHRALQLGADDFLVKPLDAGISLSKIKATLELRRQKARRVQVEPGDRLGSKYRLEELIGTGGFGTVFRATHLGLEVDLAVKVLHSHVFADYKSRSRLKTEGKALARLDHPNTVRVWDLVTTEDPPYLVMDFLEGQPLSEVLLQNGPIPARMVCRLAIQVAEGLRAAHRMNLVHRDVKPQNIFLCKNQPRDATVKLLDFGLAYWARDSQRDPSSESGLEVLGTPRYLAPERILGDPGGKPGDIYSLGIVLFEMLSSSFPYAVKTGSLASLVQAHSLGTVRSFSDLGLTVPLLLEGLIRWTLRREPDQRPDCDQVLSSLREIADSLRDGPTQKAVPNRDIPWGTDTEPIDLTNLSDDPATES